MIQDLMQLKGKLRENPASFTTDEKTFLGRLLTADDELGNLRRIAKEFSNRIDDCVLSARLATLVSSLVSPMARLSMEDPGAEERILYWDPETETLEDFSETGTVNIGDLYGTPQDILDGIIDRYIRKAA